MSNGQLVIVPLCARIKVPVRLIAVGRNEVVVCGEDEYQKPTIEKRAPAFRSDRHDFARGEREH